MNKKALSLLSAKHSKQFSALCNAMPMVEGFGYAIDRSTNEGWDG